MIDEHLRLGHAIKIDPTKKIAAPSRIWYLPHHAVVNPNKWGKLRLVFDASAKHPRNVAEWHTVDRPGLDDRPVAVSEDIHSKSQVFEAVSSPTTCVRSHFDKPPKTTSKRLIELLGRGGFRLYQWLSSSRKVLRSFSSSKWSNPEFEIDLEQQPVERTLGLYWNCEEYSFCFKRYWMGGLLHIWAWIQQT